MSMISEPAFQAKIKEKLGRDLDDREKEVAKNLYSNLKTWYDRRPQFVDVKKWDGPT